MSDMLRDELREGSRSGRIELHGVDVIAESERHGEPRSLFWPWCAANVAVLAVSWGGYVLGMGINLAQGLLVTLFGVIASFLLVGLASLAGQKGIAPTLVLSRAAFGVRGNCCRCSCPGACWSAGRPRCARWPRWPAEPWPNRLSDGSGRWPRRSRSRWWPAAASTSAYVASTRS